MKKFTLKSVLKELFIASVIIFIVSNVISYIRKPNISPNTLPQIEVKLLDGSDYSTKKGKPFVLHIWATWCPACKLEAPNIQSVSKDYEVLTFAVNSGDDKNLQAYMDEHELNFRVVNDQDGTWSRAFKIKAFPTTFIYDSKGKLRFTEVGYTSTAGLLARLKLIE